MFAGANVAIVTPFSSGAVDFDKLGELIDFQLENGTAGIVPCGTTGESATLSEEEHRQVIEYVVKRVNGKAKVIAGSGSNSTATAIELTKHAQKAGADGALVITPYYNKPTQEGLYNHFRAVAEACSIPIVLYNVPGRTGVNMLPETVARLAADFPNIVALKDATGNINQATKTLNLVQRKDFILLSGEDAIVFPLLAIGGKGVISVVSNVAPASMAKMIAAYEKGDIDGAREIHYRQYDLCSAMFVETNPAPVKTALAMMGKCSDEIRLPLVPLQEASRKKLQAVLKDFGLL